MDTVSLTELEEMLNKGTLNGSLVYRDMLDGESFEVSAENLTLLFQTLLGKIKYLRANTHQINELSSLILEQAKEMKEVID